MDTFDLRLWKGFIKACGKEAAPAFIDQIAIDSRRINSTHALFVALPGSTHDGHKFVNQADEAGARYALVNEKWPFSHEFKNIQLLKVENPLRSFQEIAKAYRKSLGCRVVCIAGSYGKTMVKDLLQMMISHKVPSIASPESFNSQIGVPLSLLTIKKEHAIALIEASISQRNEMDFLADMIAADACVITHVGKKHLATLGNISTAVSEIIKICMHPKTEEWVILPNDIHVIPHLSKIRAPYHFWNEISASQPFLPHAHSLSLKHSSCMPYVVEFPDGNRHLGQTTCGFYYFIDLINITIKAAWLLGVSSDDIRLTLDSYTPEPMRTEIWKTPLGATFINDPYCSDPQSVDVALRHLEQAPQQARKIFIFGGMKASIQQSESDYCRVGKAINRIQPHALILVGNHPFHPLIQEVNSCSPSTKIFSYPNFVEALFAMRQQLKQDDIILIKGEKKEPLDTVVKAFEDSINSNQCFINLAAIQTNIETIRHKLPKKTRLMVMVKALAYGTDEIRMAKFLRNSGIDILGVSYVDEGIALKRAGVSQEIFVINAALYEAVKVAKWDLQIGVSNRSLIEAVAREALNLHKKIKVHLHIDSGMSRFGCRPEEALELANLIKNCPALEFEGIMTHFASAEDPSQDSFTLEQAYSFENTIQELEYNGFKIPWKHAANSSAAIRFQFPQFNMVRLGLAVFGLYSSEATKKSMDLRLALSLQSRIVGINVCKAGDTISYGRSYVVQKETQRIAVLPIGYFDGLHRSYSGKGSVIIRGQKAAMVGKICMDFMMVDITDIPNAEIGDPVLIFGEDEYGHYLSPEDLAFRGDSIIYELITCLGPRIQRIFVYEEAHTLR
jgi:Alr-MurF fusion protein